MKLTEFLLARIAEDEANAIVAIHYGHLDFPDLEYRWEWLCLYKPKSRLSGWSRSNQGEAPSPERVLAECEAKRFLIGQARMQIAASDEVPEDEPDEVNNNGRKHGAAEAYEKMLGQFALPYAEHPDYNPEWAA